MPSNYTPELARLMTFTGETATAIRMYSAYSGGSPATYFRKQPDPKRDALDLMFLADALHHFERIGRAIECGDPAGIVEACDSTMRIFSDYAKDQPQFGDRQAKATFELWRDFVRLDLALDALREVRAKAASLTPHEHTL